MGKKVHNNKEVTVSDDKAETVKTDKAPMPSAERLIKENNLDSSSIKGHGKDGRITKGDTLSAIANTKLNSPVLTESSTDQGGVMSIRTKRRDECVCLGCVKPFLDV